MKAKYKLDNCTIFYKGEVVDCSNIGTGIYRISNKKGFTLVGESELDATVEILNDKPGRPLNTHLELTPESEIKRLNKVIEEKNRAIAGFKKYDADRKVYYERLEENYKIMEERFNEFNAIVEKCDDVEPNSKAFIEKVVRRLYKHRVNDDIEGGALSGVQTRLTKMDSHLTTIASLASLVDNQEVRDNIIKEVRALQQMRGNAISYIKRKLGKLLDNN